LLQQALNAALLGARRLLQQAPNAALLGARRLLQQAPGSEQRRNNKL